METRTEEADQVTMLLGRGDRRAEAGRIGEQFADTYGREAAEALFAAILHGESDDTFVVVTSAEMRRFFLQHTDWMEWTPGATYPWR